MLDHIRQIKNGWGVASFDRRICFLTEEYKEDKIKVKRYFLMAKHLFTFLPLHLFTLPPFYFFTSSPFPPLHLPRRSIFSPFYLFTLPPFHPFSSQRGIKRKARKQLSNNALTSPVQLQLICTPVPTYLEQCSR